MRRRIFVRLFAGHAGILCVFQVFCGQYGGNNSNRCVKAVQICSELVLCCLNKADAPQIFLSGCLQDTQEYFVYFKCTADSMAENMQADACEGSITYALT